MRLFVFTMQVPEMDESAPVVALFARAPRFLELVHLLHHRFKGTPTGLRADHYAELLRLSGLDELKLAELCGEASGEVLHGQEWSVQEHADGGSLFSIQVLEVHGLHAAANRTRGPRATLAPELLGPRTKGRHPNEEASLAPRARGPRRDRELADRNRPLQRRRGLHRASRGLGLERLRHSWGRSDRDRCGRLFGRQWNPVERIDRRQP